jgi:anti-sigma regulatory factor (Ser/Thr protein kinase)
MDLSISIQSDVKAISPLVDKLMMIVRGCRCVPEQEEEIEVALREALANAVLHGNRQNAGKESPYPLSYSVRRALNHRQRRRNRI